jgi:hypothetical protein
MAFQFLFRAAPTLVLAWVSLAADSPGVAGADPGWPRQYTDAAAKLVVYQPQIDSWKDFRKMEGRFAVALTPKGGQTVYGAVRVDAETSVDAEARSVGFTKFVLSDVTFSGAKDEARAAEWKALTLKLFPKQPAAVALDRVLAYMDTGQIKPREIAVKLDPPPILVATQPSVLVMIDGEPALYDLEGTSLQKVVNTNWDLLFDKKEKRYYLRSNRTWLSAKALNDSWKMEKKLPEDFAKLPASPEFKEIKESAAAPRQESPGLVLVVNKPTELILVTGAPALERIGETPLYWVANSPCDVFFHSTEKAYYFLTSGRWFRSAELTSGKWAPATANLPAEFKGIPTTHPRAHVLASVPGTRQAQDAVLAASIPHRATIDRKTAKAEVQYIGGEPKFEQIAGTSLSYAVNTPSDVVKVGEHYYLCLDGVWFMSAAAKGPWTAADKVPEEIYSIPPESPKHNVTYVNIYDSSADTVEYGYTSGYMGVYVGYGVAMWGTGYYYPPYYGWGYYPYPVYWPAAYYTYGASAWYNAATGGYVRGSAVYGPYGGYGRAAAYNPSTGRYSWGQSAWGPYGAAATGGFYNPNTGGWGGTARASNGYQSWGTSVVGRGDQYARTASYSDSRGTVGAAKGSGGGGAIAARGSNGQGGAVARSGSGDVYAGRDGNVYKRDSATGDWSRNNGSGGWESVNRPSGGSATRDQARSAAESRAGGGSSSQVQSLNRDAAARSWGNQSAQRSTSSWGGGGGGMSRGGGYASRGGGGRRR